MNRVVDWQQFKLLQQDLAEKVLLEDFFEKEYNLVGGIDVSYPRLGRQAKSCGAVVVLNRADWRLVDRVVAFCDVAVPYVPGFLSFREVPAILEAMDKLTVLPDIWLVDGAGIAHPRRIGLASHLGVLLDVPTIGVAKSRLVGTHDELGEERGSRVPLLDDGTQEQIGWVLRSRKRVKPLYVSPGHKVSMESAVKIVLACCTRYRLPEPIRAAHNMVTQCKNKIPS
jgi:deoxyribonuclease V